jgi:hypothetical protein
MITITGTIHFDTADERNSFEFPVEEISKITRHSAGTLSIKLRGGKSYKLCVVNDAGTCGGAVEPLVAALTESVSAPPNSVLSSETRSPRKPQFAPILPPGVSPDVSGAHSTIVVVGQSAEQVKAALGQPDRIDFPPSLALISHKMIWSYGSLTVTFVEGKVSVVEQENRPGVR